MGHLAQAQDGVPGSLHLFRWSFHEDALTTWQHLATELRPSAVILPGVPGLGFRHPRGLPEQIDPRSHCLLGIEAREFGPGR